ncbi:MAG: hypothetical protein JMM79_00210 [Candidatus Xiphinematobacter sp.]|nr:MAG: hypothetical protein JMM79_00210 [Candidatus Xiphinematobacter sp.]
MVLEKRDEATLNWVLVLGFQQKFNGLFNELGFHRFPLQPGKRQFPTDPLLFSKNLERLSSIDLSSFFGSLD